MEKLLKKLKVKYERFNAIKPEKTKILKIKNKLSNKVVNFLENKNTEKRAIGIVGCSCSHYYVLLRAKELDYDYITVLEDDVSFTQKSINKLNKIINILNKNFKWDILRVVWDRIYYKNGKEKIYNKDNILIYKFNGVSNESKFKKKSKTHTICGGTHFYIINKKNINKIIKYLKEENIYSIDALYSTNKINSFIVFNRDVFVKDSVIHGTSIPKIKHKK